MRGSSARGGTGPGGGTVKFKLPEAHTDYIFSVVGEEFGLIACFMLAGLFMGLVVRALLVAMDEEDPFVFLATAGLAAQFGFQAAINMMVNLALLPTRLLVGKCLVVQGEDDAASIAAVARALDEGAVLQDPLELRPLPLAGIPAWAAAQQARLWQARRLSTCARAGSRHRAAWERGITGSSVLSAG